MQPILYVNAWPSAQETVTPREHFNIGWVTDADDETISQVLDALDTLPLGDR